MPGAESPGAATATAALAAAHAPLFACGLGPEPLRAVGCQRSEFEPLALGLGGGAKVGLPTGADTLGLESSPRDDPSIGQKAASSS
jgi:hypothetical protein